jgi:glycosyltransferase involved in cell wall biosynthesis
MDSRIRLLANSRKVAPAALNVGIRAAKGEIVIRIDGHTIIEPDYVEKCVGALAATCADNVGGCMIAEGETYIARAIALATSSPFGVGSARFHYAEKAGWADTVYLGAYPIKVFERIGLFDEELVRNQDDEFNYRLIRAGGKIWLDPRIHSTYYSRASLPALWKQYFEYGFWKVRVIQKHGRPASLRHLVPGLFAAVLAGAVIASILTSSILPTIMIVVPYLSISAAASLWLAARKGWQYLLILPFAFAAMHLAYGFGFLLGVIRFGAVGHLQLSKGRQ